MQRSIFKVISGAVLVAVGCVVVVWIARHPSQHPYWHNTGTVFGTYYNICYQSESDLLNSITAQMQSVDDALSMFNDSSLISSINRNEEVTINQDVLRVYTTSQWVNQVSDGAFDITVAPLVNAWGFGFKHKNARLEPQIIDSLLRFVGMQHIQVQDKHLIKDDPRVMIDASAIAKGYACDKVAEALRQAGCQNYLVDIGGEIVLKGQNEHGKPWSIGITRPEEDSTCTQQNLQAIIHSDSLAMATSGNYRRFYYEGEQKRSHTIDPRTGYPVNHSLLSATVIADNCMKADAIATACMVLGTQKSMQMIDHLDNVACYLIVAQGDSMVVVTSANWEKITKM